MASLGYRVLDPPRSQAGLFATALNLSNNMIGAGLLSMPYCMMEATVVSGCVIFGLTAVVAGMSFMLLARSCDLANSYSYLEMGRQALGENFGTLVLVFVLCYCIGVNITQIVLLGDFLVLPSGVLGTWAPDSFLFRMDSTSRRLLVVGLVATVFLFPLSLLRSLAPLKFTSTVSFMCIAFTVFLCAYTLAAKPVEAGLKPVVVDWSGLDVSAFAAIPIVNVAFTAHYNSPRFYKELGNDEVKMGRVVMISVAFTLCVYVTTALCGYLLFGDDTCGDVLSNFNKDYTLAIAGRCALICLIICTFPFACFAIRNTLIQLAFGGRYDMETFPTSYHILLSAGVVAFVVVIGCVETDVRVVLAYNGSIFGSCIVYIFPPLIYASLHAKMQSIPLLAPAADEEQNENALERRSGKVVIPFLWGLVAFFLGVTVNALKQAKVIGVQDNPLCG